MIALKLLVVAGVLCATCYLAVEGDTCMGDAHRVDCGRSLIGSYWYFDHGSSSQDACVVATNAMAVTMQVQVK